MCAFGITSDGQLMTTKDNSTQVVFSLEVEHIGELSHRLTSAALSKVCDLSLVLTLSIFFMRLLLNPKTTPLQN